MKGNEEIERMWNELGKEKKEDEGEKKKKEGEEEEKKIEVDGNEEEKKEEEEDDGFAALCRESNIAFFGEERDVDDDWVILG